MPNERNFAIRASLQRQSICSRESGARLSQSSGKRKVRKPSAAKRSRSASARSQCPLSASWLKYRSRTRLIVHSTPPQSSIAGLGFMFCSCDGFISRQLFVKGQCLPDDLVHVVITIGRESPDETDVRPAQSELPIFRIDRRVLGPRNWVIRVSVRARIFADHAGPGVLLA